jgi:hypothetical protein
VVTTSFGLKGVSQDTLDMVVWDINKNDIFDNDSDMVIVGWPVQDDSDPETCMWGGTAFTIDFKQNAMTGEWPEKGDIYRLNFERPFFENDSLAFTARKYNAPEKEDINSDMDKIKVVPNPYIATNTMEPAVMNPYLNQERKLMFTHIPADCDINIFTSSGMLVDRIKVRNKPRNGIIHWDLLSKEGLEIAAGMYIYHIKSNSTGKEKTGTFAIIK